MGALVELRLLDGPNLYFPRPAARAVLAVTALHALSRERIQSLARDLGLSSVRPGAAHTAFRQRCAARLVTHLVRRLARDAGSARVAVRVRPGAEVDHLVVAFPWRHAGRATALAEQVAGVLDTLDLPPSDLPPSDRSSDAESIDPVERIVPAQAPVLAPGVLAQAARRIADAEPGEAPRLIRPRIPVVAVTGTNGKTTTSRMLGHIAGRAGLSVGWSSTDGIYLNGELIEAGDYSGPAGAARVLAQPGVELAVTETARGGILRRGVGVSHNDVSVVTNVSADHLGLGGIDTLDQLAEVKAVITRITRPGGWCVLNADDPRTFAMRLQTPARVWVFTRDPDSPTARQVLTEGGRVTTVLDGWAAVLQDGTDARPVVEVAAVPMTLAGLSRVNVENVLAAVSAALALGLTEPQVEAGLLSFDPGLDNPGRMNIWSRDEQTVVIDLAHNEAGLSALLEILRGIAPPGARLLLGIGTAGDRGDDVFLRIGELAALGADHLELAHKDDYLRGRTMEQMGALLRAGAARAGRLVVAEHRGELDAVRSLLAAAGPHDVVGCMVHQDRAAIETHLSEHGFHPNTPESLRQLVQRAKPAT